MRGKKRYGGKHAVSNFPSTSRSGFETQSYLCEGAEACLAADGAEVAKDCEGASQPNGTFASLSRTRRLTFLSSESSRVGVDNEAETFRAVG